MKIQRPGLIAALTLLISACSSVADKDGKEIRMTGNQLVDPDKVTCKSIVKTGTRIGTRVCMTNRAWHRKSMESREAAEAIQRKSKQSVDANAGG